MKTEPLTFMDLFAGCGGLSLGFEQAGLVPVYVNELSPDALNTYLWNRDDLRLVKKYNSNDILELSDDPDLGALVTNISNDFTVKDKKYPIDFIVGGPPCQGYSGIGHRRSYSVDKKDLRSNHLYREMAKVIQQIQPKMFLFENVKGLKTSRWTRHGEKGEIWEDVLSTFKNQVGDYYVQDILINASDYGVPQNRPRVFIIGVHERVGFTPSEELPASGLFPKPICEPPPDIQDVLSDLVDPNYKVNFSSPVYVSEPHNDLQKKFRLSRDKSKVAGISSPLTEQDYSKHSQRVEKRFSMMINENRNMKDLPFEYQINKFSQKLLPPKWTARPNITVTSLPDDYVHYSQPRALTVREWARLQMFPDWYEFKGKRTTGGIRRAGNPRLNNFDRELPKYTQIGNAVPVKLAEEIGRHFKALTY